MANQDHHRQIDFINKNMKNRFNYFNASVCIDRLEVLQIDLDLIKSSFLPGPLSYPGITNYYIVAVASCLEWHAKSRLYDFIRHKPSSITDKDISNIKIPTDLASSDPDITLQQKIASSIKISSYYGYKSIIERIISHYNDGFRIHKLENRPNEFKDIINYVFNERHRTVHEVSTTALKNMQVQEERVDEIYNTIIESIYVIKKIEDFIRDFLPDDFPNKLNEEYYISSRLQLLKNVIYKKEAEISEIIKNNFSDNFFTGWHQSCKEFMQYADNDYGNMMPLLNGQFKLTIDPFYISEYILEKRIETLDRTKYVLETQVIPNINRLKPSNH